MRACATGQAPPYGFSRERRAIRESPLRKSLPAEGGGATGGAFDASSIPRLRSARCKMRFAVRITKKGTPLRVPSFFYARMKRPARAIGQ